MPIKPPRVGLVLPYWSFWENSAGGPSFRRDREATLTEIERTLAAIDISVEVSALVDSEQLGAEVGARMAGAGVQAIVVAQTMAVPPSYAMAALDANPKVPVVVWASQLVDTVAVDFDEASITEYGATVGTPMLTNVLGRRGTAYALVFGSSDDVLTDVSTATRAAATAHSVRTGRMARIDHPLDGYECVDVDNEKLTAALGLEVVAMEADELVGRYRRGAGPVADVTTEVRTGFEISDEVDDEALQRAVGLAAALEDLDDSHDISMGAINCHIPALRFGDDPGMTACYGVGRETTRGIPWTCVGDAVTAVAMHVGHHLGGAALYHEIEAVDFETGEVAIANSGEHDLSWCPNGQRPRLIPNRWFSGDNRMTPSAWFELPAGPATLLGFTPHASEVSGFRFVVAEGEITTRSFPNSPTVGGAFRFQQPVDGAWHAWAVGGVNHHSAVSPGHLAAAVEMVAGFLGVGCVRI